MLKVKNAKKRASEKRASEKMTSKYFEKSTQEKKERERESNIETQCRAKFAKCRLNVKTDVLFCFYNRRQHFAHFNDNISHLYALSDRINANSLDLIVDMIREDEDNAISAIYEYDLEKEMPQAFRKIAQFDTRDGKKDKEDDVEDMDKDDDESIQKKDKGKAKRREKVECNVDAIRNDVTFIIPCVVSVYLFQEDNSNDVHIGLSCVKKDNHGYAQIFMEEHHVSVFGQTPETKYDAVMNVVSMYFSSQCPLQSQQQQQSFDYICVMFVGNSLDSEELYCMMEKANVNMSKSQVICLSTKDNEEATQMKRKINTWFLPKNASELDKQFGKLLDSQQMQQLYSYHRTCTFAILSVCLAIHLFRDKFPCGQPSAYQARHYHYVPQLIEHQEWPIHDRVLSELDICNSMSLMPMTVEAIYQKACVTRLGKKKIHDMLKVLHWDVKYLENQYECVAKTMKLPQEYVVAMQDSFRKIEKLTEVKEKRDKGDKGEKGDKADKAEKDEKGDKGEKDCRLDGLLQVYVNLVELNKLREWVFQNGDILKYFQIFRVQGQKSNTKRTKDDDLLSFLDIVQNWGNWIDGMLEMFHEHFTIECLQHFLEHGEIATFQNNCVRIEEMYCLPKLRQTGNEMEDGLDVECIVFNLITKAQWEKYQEKVIHHLATDFKTECIVKKNQSIHLILPCESLSSFCSIEESLNNLQMQQMNWKKHNDLEAKNWQRFVQTYLQLVDIPHNNVDKIEEDLRATYLGWLCHNEKRQDKAKIKEMMEKVDGFMFLLKQTPGLQFVVFRDNPQTTQSYGKHDISIPEYLRHKLQDEGARWCHSYLDGLALEKKETVYKGNKKMRQVNCEQYNKNLQLYRDSIDFVMDYNAAFYKAINKKMFESNSLYLRQIEEVISVLDATFAKSALALKYKYVRPSIARQKTKEKAREAVEQEKEQDNGYLKATGIYNILMQHCVPDKLQVKTSRIEIGSVDGPTGLNLFGKNNAGKTMLLTGTAIAIILAQTGFYVPALTFEFSPYHRIFTTIAISKGDIMRGESSGMEEATRCMEVIHYAKKNGMFGGKRTLFFSDEIFTRTTTDRAIALSVSTMRRFQDHNVSFFITTHHDNILPNPSFIQMCVEGYCQVRYMRNYQLEVEDVGNNALNDDEEFKTMLRRQLQCDEDQLLYFEEELNWCKKRKLQSIANAGEKTQGEKREKENVLGISSFLSGEANKISGDKKRVKRNVYNPKMSSSSDFVLCEKCNIRIARQTDHVIPQVDADKDTGVIHSSPFAPFHMNALQNLSALCEECHHEKTTRENQARNQQKQKKQQPFQLQDEEEEEEERERERKRKDEKRSILMMAHRQIDAYEKVNE